MHFRVGQLVRINQGHPHVQDSNLYGESVVSCRRYPLVEPDAYGSYMAPDLWNTVPTDAIGIVLNTELDDAEIKALKRSGFYPLVQEIIVALMGENKIYIKSEMLEDLEDEE